jgi:hypothetical protein
MADSRYHIDPNCPCRECLKKCDLDDELGRIPTNGTWWMQQTKYPAELHGQVTA